jgi:hypothetical protein
MAMAHNKCINKVTFATGNGGFCNNHTQSANPTFYAFCGKGCFDNAVRLLSAEAVADIQSVYRIVRSRANNELTKNFRRGILARIHKAYTDARDTEESNVRLWMQTVYLPQFMQRYNYGTTREARFSYTLTNAIIDGDTMLIENINNCKFSKLFMLIFAKH